MRKNVSEERDLVCGQAQKRFAALDAHSRTGLALSVTDRAATENHIQKCSRCALEYRLFALQCAALDAAGTPEPIIPDEHFYKALRARIARGPDELSSRSTDESWAAALLLTARQLFPVMAVLLLVMIGATFLWNRQPSDTSQAAVRPRERVMFSDMYDYPAPTRDDVLETLVAIEEK
jgi:predicted anti-sigma-YlaC factor YlaD